ncbi:MAG TPA: metallo-beta-lactamase [Vicinamibacterales bacterium]|nr:metallo-beta-lactamase [Vicinamibacterales bacterium]
MSLVAAVLALFATFIQTPAFKSDPPHKCDNCDEWNKPREPFKVFGNTYFVGTDGLSAILIVGDAGLILLDGGLEQSAAVIDANIRKLGFKTQDITLIVNSHGHFDHAGGIAALQRASGAMVAASPSGADALRRGENTTDDPQYGFGKKFNGFPPVKNVRVIKDGEALSVGNLSITANFTPGHTPGSTTWTWKSCQPPRPEAATARSRRSSPDGARAEAGEGKECLNIVYADSISAAAADGFRFTDSTERINAFRRSISRVAELPCDIVISTHPSATNLDEKIKKRAAQPSGPDPFIDHGCKALAATAMKGLEARIAEEKKK